jgi:hypothetical protein
MINKIVKIMKKNIIMKGGVNVCRKDKNDGEFVINLKRDYNDGLKKG